MIPAPYRLLAMILGALLILGGVYMAGRTHGKAAVQLRWDAQASQARQAALEAEQAARAEEARRIVAVAEVANVYADKIRAARAAADRAAADAMGLRDAATAAANRPADDPAAAGGGAANRLAEVVGECADRYSAVARVADAAILAGQACERSYYALKGLGPQEQPRGPSD